MQSLLFKVAQLALVTMVASKPAVTLLTEHPSTHRRVRIAHKFGIVAIDKHGKVYLATDPRDENTLMVIWAYGLQKHRIQGKKSGLSLSMDSNGRVSAKKEITNESLFIHTVPLVRHIFESAVYKGYFLGFNKQRRPKRGNRAKSWRNDRSGFQIFRPNAFEKRNSIYDAYYKDSWPGRLGKRLDATQKKILG
eukprot:gene3096-3561_t